VRLNRTVGEATGNVVQQDERGQEFLSSVLLDRKVFAEKGETASAY
jgi:hypothetical protein